MQLERQVTACRTYLTVVASPFVIYFSQRCLGEERASHASLIWMHDTGTTCKDPGYAWQIGSISCQSQLHECGCG